MTDIDVVAPAVEVETPPVAEAVTPEVEPVATEEEPKQDEPKFTKAEVEQRIQERLAKEQRKHDRELRQRLEQENERLRNQSAPRPVEPTGRPNRENFPDDISWIRADADWAAEAKFKEKMAERDVQYQRETQQRQFEDVRNQHQRRVDALLKTNPEYDDLVMHNEDLAINRPMAEAIVLLDNGPSVALYLGKNPNEAERISRLPAALAGIELGKIAVKLEPGSAKTISTAPAPIKPVSSAKSLAADLDKMSQEEYEKARKKQGARWAR